MTDRLLFRLPHEAEWEYACRINPEDPGFEPEDSEQEPVPGPFSDAEIRKFLLDPWTRMQFEIEFLDSNGQWRELRDFEVRETNGAIILTVQRHLPHDEPLFMFLYRK